MKYIQYEVKDSVAEILLSHQPANALNEEMLDELILAINKANDDDKVKCLILGSSIANRFCAGLDLKLLRTSTSAQIHSLLTKLYIKLYDTQFNLKKPSVSAVSGAVRGGGMTVAISCDLVVTDSDATFGYPEIEIGVLPAIHYTHLPRIVGKHRAFDLLFTGRVFDAPEAHSLGLVNRVTEVGKVMDEARKLAQNLASKPAMAMAMGRSAYVYAIDSDYRRGVAAAVESFCNVAATDEAKEGMNAFAEKRKPSWQQ